MPSLVSEAKSFGDKVQHLLEGTMAERAPMMLRAIDDTAVLRPREPEGSPSPWGIVQLTPPVPGAGALYLRLMYGLGLNDAGFLTVRASSYGLMVEPDKGRCFLRIEFDRGKQGRLPEAHLQVDADSTLLGWALARTGRPHHDLHDLHIPSGGRRFRPALEDVVDFLAEAKLAGVRDGWQGVVDAHRREFEDLQARATVRRNPDVAAEVLSDLGWKVSPPET